MLKENVLIRTVISDERDVIDDFSYRYSENNWVTNDRAFDKELSYLEGIKEIVDKVGYGEIYIDNKLVEKNLNSIVNALRKV